MKAIHGLGLGVFGFCTGLAIASGGFTNDIGKLISMLGVGALPASFITYLVADTKSQRLLNHAENKNEQAGQTLHKIIREFDNCKSKLATVSSQLESLKDELKEARNTINSLGNSKLENTGLIAQLQARLNQLSTQTQKDAQRIEYLQAETEQWEFNFKTQVEAEANKRLQVAKSQELEKIYNEHDLITSEAMALFRRLQSWGEKVAHGHQSKAEIIKSLASSYNENLDEVGEAIAHERQNYLLQIELLNERVGQLQQQLQGDLVEPVYGDFGFDVNGKIANEIARTLFTDISLALSVKGFQVKPDGVVDVGYGYSRSVHPKAIVEAILKHSETITKKLGLFKITSVRKLEITDCIVVSYRVEPAIKADEIRLMLGTADEFINYVVSHPIRYRLIADPGMGKTPTSAVMISEILKAGCTRGNTGKGEKVPYTLVNVSYPGAIGSLKDSSYPLDIFLQYGDTTAAIKSFEDCLDDGRFRIQNPNFAANYFQIWVWEELDNTLNSSSEPYQTGENFKKILKQFGHNNIGWIVSGQSVMTKQIPGFTNDDRSLFTEIIIGIPKIRHYLNTYGKGKNSESNLAKLTRNLDAIEEYIDHKNELVTDDARLLRVALIVDSRSPKLYFLPNLDMVNFNYQEIEDIKRLARLAKASGMSGNTLVSESSKRYTGSAGTIAALPPISTIGGSHQSGTSPHCPHCGSANLKLQNDDRYRCLDCKKRTVSNKIVWK
jgi:DNA-directed RNA polymerase subunit RPC12/RpoP/flagellar biosynthesis chaperone FliJ